MKARVKATGAIKEVSRGIYSPYQFVDNEGTIYTENDVEELDELEELSEGGGVIFIDDTPDYWTRLEHQYVGMAMQGILTNPIGFENIRARGTNIQIETALLASEFAHALVQKLKEKEE